MYTMYSFLWLLLHFKHLWWLNVRWDFVLLLIEYVPDIRFSKFFDFRNLGIFKSRLGACIVLLLIVQAWRNWAFVNSVAHQYH